MKSFSTILANTISHRDCRVRALGETNLRIGEVASALGYDSLSLFSRQFTSAYSLSPGAYRQRGDLAM